MTKEILDEVIVTLSYKILTEPVKIYNKSDAIG